MPDLRALLATKARRLKLNSVPAFDDLLARVRGRRAARAATTVFCVAVAVTAVAGCSSWLSPGRSSRPASSPPSTAATTQVGPEAVPPEVYSRLSALAVALAKKNGDPNPTRLEAVQVNPTRPAASRQPS